MHVFQGRADDLVGRRQRLQHHAGGGGGDCGDDDIGEDYDDAAAIAAPPPSLTPASGTCARRPIPAAAGPTTTQLPVYVIPHFSTLKPLMF